MLAGDGYKWVRRFVAEGMQGLRDRSSRPHRSPARLSAAREAAILARREATLEGPHRIAWALGEVPSTVHRVLRRRGAPRLRDLDRPTRTVVRYERDRPGELVHVDVKKQGRIPDFGGWRIHGKAVRRGGRINQGLGYDFVHAAVDDRSGWRTPRSCRTSARRPPPRSWPEPWRSSPSAASGSNGC